MMDNGIPLLQARRLAKCYTLRRSGKNQRRKLDAVDGVDLDLWSGVCVALVGESGSGKSTVSRLLAQLSRPSRGEVLLRGKRVRVRMGRSRRRYAGQVQLLLQDPFSSLNPLHTVRYHLARVLRLHGHARRGRDIDQRLAELLTRVQLSPPEQFLDKLPHELSGGQLQRVAIARALAARPVVLLADEPVSMLDVSIRLGILNLLKRLKDEENLALLYITHDIASARYFAEQTVVMYRGRLVEGGPSEEVTQQSAHPYTQLLISSAPDPEREAETGPVAHGHTPPASVGCPFANRCPHAMDVCIQRSPGVTDLGGGHWVRCWLHATDVPAQHIPLHDNGKATANQR
jgi:peptide/nickel transport system ATP-binding protein